MIIISNDYWKDFMDAPSSSPIDKVEIELTAGTWTDITAEYEGGATFDQEKERAPDKISGGDTRYTFDNSADKFTPLDASSIFYGVIYQGKRIRFSVGFSQIGTYSQSIMVVKDIKWDYDSQKCYIHCQELMQRLVDEELNSYPSTLIAIPNAGNTGNGTITQIQTKPFDTVTEDWTVTLTGAAVFGVTGSVSGAQAGGIVGTEYTSDSDEIKFTISAGGVAYINGDSFTFSTIQYPEWTTTNPAKIIWSILTGYGYDSGTQDAWSAAVLALDSTKSVDNPDINYTSFVNAIADIDNNLTGYIPYDKSAATAIEEIIIHFLGSIYTDNEGRISIGAYKPSFGDVLLREFADTKKVFTMEAEADTAKIINQVTVRCKRSASWAWSNASETTDDVYTNSNSTSITNYGLKNPFSYVDSYWYSANRAAQEWFADRLIDKFGGVPNPPLEISFETGLDGMRMNLANRMKFTDSRTGYSNKLLEVMRIQKDFESDYKNIKMMGTDTGTEGIQWCFLGSSANERDGISPQEADWDSASATSRQFCYLSTTGATSDPRFYLF